MWLKSRDPRVMTPGGGVRISAGTALAVAAGVTITGLVVSAGFRTSSATGDLHLVPVRQDSVPPGDDLLDDDLLGGDDLLGDDQAYGNPWEESQVDPVQAAAAAAHEALFRDDHFPLATECRTCHPDHYREWSVSQHAYAQVSPIFNAMHARITELTNGTNGDFCIRCHTPVGMALGEPLFGPNSERDPVSLEGVTCIVCHRQDESFGKNSGRTPIREGDLFAPVNGPRNGDEVARVIASPDEFGPVVTEAGRRGRRIHAEAHFFEPITQPGFCGSCHDVTLVNGFRLEEAFSEYKQSPAAERGETCQDCHMGKV
ncbi:MAG: hypothetical protein KDA21_00310, partial [Phycisphaerales bacterium]|nr:hypothetical protein [Phycisphaerales bacterium]